MARYLIPFVRTLDLPLLVFGVQLVARLPVAWSLPMASMHKKKMESACILNLMGTSHHHRDLSYSA
eukprot:7010016-Karenia_brevis.AAC.1